MMVLISLYLQAATAWALGQIGRHTPEHAKAVALTNVLESLLFCCRNSASSEDLQAKVTMLVHHLPINSGTLGQNVTGKIILARATRKFSKSERLKKEVRNFQSKCPREKCAHHFLFFVAILEVGLKIG